VPFFSVTPLGFQSYFLDSGKTSSAWSKGR